MAERRERPAKGIHRSVLQRAPPESQNACSIEAANSSASRCRSLASRVSQWSGWLVALETHDSPMEVRCRSLRPSMSFCCASCRRRATPRRYGSLEGPRDDTDVERPSICDILPSEPSKKLEPDATVARRLLQDAPPPVYPEAGCPETGVPRNRAPRKQLRQVRTGTARAQDRD
jgi:hypothetical protein